MHVYVRGLPGNLITSNSMRDGVSMMAKADEYVKYLTEQFVNYMERPREERKQLRSSAKASREPWLTRWFGWGPVSLLIWWRGRNNNVKRSGSADSTIKTAKFGKD